MLEIDLKLQLKKIITNRRQYISNLSISEHADKMIKEFNY